MNWLPYIFSALSTLTVMIAGWIWSRRESNRRLAQEKLDTRLEDCKIEHAKYKEKTDAKFEVIQSEHYKLELRFTRTEGQVDNIERLVEQLTADVKADINELKTEFKEFATEMRAAIRGK